MQTTAVGLDDEAAECNRESHVQSDIIKIRDGGEIMAVDDDDDHNDDDDAADDDSL